jgi:raffinose/stachyose/melibiose transport system permease protein
MLSIAVLGIIFYYLFGSYNGVINEAIVALGGKRISWFDDAKLSMLVLMIASVWQNFGLNMLFFMAGLQSIPDELYDAAAIDGAGRGGQFFRITLPMLGPVTQMVILNALLGSLKITDLILVMTDGRPDGATQMMMSFIYRQYFPAGGKAAGNYGYGAVLTIMSILILGVVTVIYLRATRKGADILQ